jgi:tRNA(Ile2) C34 agmatinyltransferase TiaS
MEEELDSLQSISAEENVKVCPECGGNIDTDGTERFCTKCGFVLE